VSWRQQIASVPGHLVGKACEILYRKLWEPPQPDDAPPVTLEDITQFLDRIGARKGSTLFVHSSWKRLARGEFTPTQLIKALREVIGEQGTLAMPAYPPYAMQKSSAVFDVRKTPSGGGLLTDMFRRYPGVLRSINLNHSVCAIGPQADFLTRDHHLGETTWDSCSPYYRLREIENAWIVGLGVGHRLKVATSLHCVESALCRENAYYRQLFGEVVRYRYVTADGQISEHCYPRRIGQIYPPKIARHFSANELMEESIHGLEVYAIPARILIDKAIALGQKGTTMYVWPIPWPWHFRS
jgi:aminoglycoside 3-N-acetyltransferase